jgi:hypothetical protein
MQYLTLTVFQGEIFDFQHSLSPQVDVNDVLVLCHVI